MATQFFTVDEMRRERAKTLAQKIQEATAGVGKGILSLGEMQGALEAEKHKREQAAEAKARETLVQDREHTRQLGQDEELRSIRREGVAEQESRRVEKQREDELARAQHELEVAAQGAANTGVPLDRFVQEWRGRIDKGNKVPEDQRVIDEYRKAQAQARQAQDRLEAQKKGPAAKKPAPRKDVEDMLGTFTSLTEVGKIATLAGSVKTGLRGATVAELNRRAGLNGDNSDMTLLDGTLRDTINEYIKRISGTAVAVGEAPRLLGALPALKDEPERFLIGVARIYEVLHQELKAGIDLRTQTYDMPGVQERFARFPPSPTPESLTDLYQRGGYDKDEIPSMVGQAFRGVNFWRVDPPPGYKKPPQPEQPEVISGDDEDAPPTPEEQSMLDEVNQ